MTSHRLLFVIGQLSGGGAERQLYYLLSQLGEPARVLSLSPGGIWTERIRGLGIDVVELDRTRRFEVRRFRRTIEVVRRTDPEIVHIFCDGIATLYARLAALFLGHRRVVVGQRTVPAYYPGWYRSSLTLLDRPVAAVVCNSRAAVEEVRTWVEPAEKVTYIPNCITREVGEARSAEQRRARRDQGAPLTVTMVANLTPVKNPMLFVEMARRVAAERADVRFRILGEGPMRGPLEGRIRAVGLGGRVTLPGYVENVGEYLAETDVFCLTSTHEGAPNALLEAFAAGVPAVTTRVGDAGSLVERYGAGRTAPSGDAETLTRGVLELLGDPELRHRCGTAGLEAARSHHSPESMAAAYRALYDHVLGTG